MNSLLKNKIVVKLLKERGITSINDADSFLSPSFDQLHDPSLLNDIDIAKDRLLLAKQNNETIFIHGDYDVDGITSTYILTKGLKALGFKVIHFVPHRHFDGYDIKPHGVDMALDQGCSLILTCDCGTSALKTIEYANERGMDIIVTDHHLPKSTLPNALAIVNPHVGNSYPFKELCGAVVSLKLIQYIARHINPDFEELVLDRFIDIVALGIIADVVPLVDENRVLAKFGLKKMEKTTCKGLAALIKVIRLEGRPSAHDVAFKIAPRLNAVGRLNYASRALDLLLMNNDEESISLAKTLDKFNKSRQDIQSDILNQAQYIIDDQGLENDPVIICYGSEWNNGVVGIVAGKITSKYHKPCIVLNKSEEGILHGSARSVEGFHLVKNLDKVKEYLISYAGIV
jgi:single-stranded-DNA-specific exonuclease